MQLQYLLFIVLALCLYIYLLIKQFEHDDDHKKHDDDDERFDRINYSENNLKSNGVKNKYLIRYIANLNNLIELADEDFKVLSDKLIQQIDNTTITDDETAQWQKIELVDTPKQLNATNYVAIKFRKRQAATDFIIVTIKADYKLADDILIVTRHGLFGEEQEIISQPREIDQKFYDKMLNKFKEKAAKIFGEDQVQKKIFLELEPL